MLNVILYFQSNNFAQIRLKLRFCGPIDCNFCWWSDLGRIGCQSDSVGVFSDPLYCAAHSEAKRYLGTATAAWPSLSTFVIPTLLQVSPTGSQAWTALTISKSFSSSASPKR